LKLQKTSKRVLAQPEPYKSDTEHKDTVTQGTRTVTQDTVTQGHRDSDTGQKDTVTQDTRTQ